MANNVNRKLMACALAVLAWNLPMVALPNAKVIGKAVGSKAASFDGVMLPNESTILKNDMLRTSTGGQALVELSTASRLSLSENTTARFLHQRTVEVAAIASGALVAETESGNSLVVQTDKYKIEPCMASRRFALSR